MIVIIYDGIRCVQLLSMPNSPTRDDEQRERGLGVLAAGLLFAFQDELYARFEQAGHSNITPPHGAVLAHLDPGGTRATELARRSGRPKQLIGRAIDELEQLGYVERRPEPGDRRAKLIVPTPRGRQLIQLSDGIIRDIEKRPANALGPDAYRNFKHALATVTETLTAPTSRRRPPDGAE
jgi:DNA-binding MarR family transcriptional regulator